MGTTGDPHDKVIGVLEVLEVLEVPEVVEVVEVDRRKQGRPAGRMICTDYIHDKLGSSCLFAVMFSGGLPSIWHVFVWWYVLFRVNKMEKENGDTSD